MSPEQQRKLNNIAGVIAAQVLAIDEDATMSGEVPYEDSTYEDSERRQLAAFVGSKAQYYLNKWAPLLRSGTGSAGFNWAAFFLWGLWLAYRKMYKVALIFYAIIIVEAVLEQVVFVGAMGKPETPQALWPVVLLVVSLICGAYGNRWYLSHARAAVSEHSREGLPEDALLEKLSNRGWNEPRRVTIDICLGHCGGVCDAHSFGIPALWRLNGVTRRPLWLPLLTIHILTHVCGVGKRTRTGYQATSYGYRPVARPPE